MKIIGWKSLLICNFVLVLLSACGAMPSEATPTPTRTRQSSPPASPTLALPTETLVAAPRLFTEEFNSNVIHWDIFLTNGDQTLFDHSVGDGHWSFQLGGKYMYVYALYRAETYQSVRIGVRAENQGRNKNFTSLICHFDLEKGWYEFNASNDGSYYIVHGTWDLELGRPKYTRLFKGGSNLIKQRGGVNDFGLICKGTTLTLFINEEEVQTLEEQEFALSGGQVGIGVSSFDVLPIHVDIDSVTVSEP